MNHRWWKVRCWLRSARIITTAVAIIAATAAWTLVFLWLGRQADAWLVNFPPSGNIGSLLIGFLVIIGCIMWLIATITPSVVIISLIWKFIKEVIDRRRRR